MSGVEAAPGIEKKGALAASCCCFVTLLSFIYSNNNFNLYYNFNFNYSNAPPTPPCTGYQYNARGGADDAGAVQGVQERCKWCSLRGGAGCLHHLHRHEHYIKIRRYYCFSEQIIFIE